MTELLAQPLADIVTSHHQSAAVFEKYDLDFCCKGKRSLQEACREKKVNPAHVLLDLQKIYETPDPGQIDFSALSLQALIDYIVQTHHAYVNREIPVIRGYLQKVCNRHGSRHPELHRIASLFEALAEEMEQHMQKEEKILFPRIAAVEKLQQKNGLLLIGRNYINAPVSVMESEHDHAGSMLQEIRHLTNSYTAPADGCTTFKLCYSTLEAFEKDLHRHVHLENNILFTKALNLF